VDVGAAQLGLLEDCTVEEADFGLTSIYPNPSYGSLRVLTTARQLSDAAVIYLYDPLGRLIGQRTFSRFRVDPTGLEVELSELPGGYYWLEVVDGDRRAMGKFVKF
jgi:hypothetical protein